MRISDWSSDVCSSDLPALIWCDSTGAEERYTFGDITESSNRFANILRAHGVQRGDRFIVMLPRLPQWQIAMVGCIKAGVVPIPCIEMLTAGDVDYRVRNAEAKGAITTRANRSEEHTSDLQSLMRISYAVLC